MEGQIYVEELTPVVSEGQIKRPWPLVLIHGAGQTGTVSGIFICVTGVFIVAYVMLFQRNLILGKSFCMN